MAGAAAAALPLFVPLAGAAGETAAAFSFDWLTERAAALARQDYRPRQPVEAALRIGYNDHWQIRYRRERSLFAGGPGYPVSFFALNKYAAKPVRVFALEEGRARPFAYSPDLFSMPADSVARDLPPEAGFAGFRIHEHVAETDWAAFQGASYFRAVGGAGQYGLSARGLAVDTGSPAGEEFPEFTEFYIAPAAEPGAPLRVYALLDGPSVAGAYAFSLERGEGVLMEVEARLFLRADIARLGVAPLTSMYWYSERDRRKGLDWRPEVHDSDGLALWTGAGERVWRPLNNPQGAVLSSFVDRDPRGFGLQQRDRDIDHYLDGAAYHLRPSLWVEPLHAWGEGSVQLFEFHTDLEVTDNVAAFWNPVAPARRGAEMDYRYRLHWLDDEPFVPSVGRVTSTRMGSGGLPGEPPKPGVVKYVVEFEGDRLEGLDPHSEIEAEVGASAGSIETLEVHPLVGTGRWRAFIDFRPPAEEPAELRAYLALDGEPLTETWLFQHRPEFLPNDA